MLKGQREGHEDAQRIMNKEYRMMKDVRERKKKMAGMYKLKNAGQYCQRF